MYAGGLDLVPLRQRMSDRNSENATHHLIHATVQLLGYLSPLPVLAGGTLAMPQSRLRPYLVLRFDTPPKPLDEWRPFLVPTRS